MLSLETRKLILRIHEEGKGIRELSRLFHIARASVRRCLRNDYKTERKVSPSRTFLNTHREVIKQMYLEHEGFCVPLQRSIKEKFNQEINLRMLERFCKCFREAIKEELKSSERTIRFETEPGDQLQIDFGEKLLNIAGELTKVYFFVCKLGYSRKIYVKAYLNKKEQSWLDGLESSFYYFGGIPVTIVSDNDTALLKIEHDKKKKTFNEGYQHFVDYYGIRAVSCSVRKPRSKGKVESAVKYVKNNALVGRSFESIKQLNTYLESWCRLTSDRRKLAGFPAELNTPQDRFLLEKSHLRLITLPRIAHLRFESRRVTSNGLVSVDGKSYALDTSFASKEVQVQISANSITISASELPTVTLDKTTEVYCPVQQKLSASAQQIRQAQERNIRQMDAGFHANPLQRPIVEYDRILNFSARVQ